MPPIQGKRVRLRLLEESDLPLTLSWRNRDSVRIWFTHSEVLTPETHRAWFENYRTRDDDFVFIIELPTDNGAPRAVGQVSVYDIDWSRRTAEIGRLLVGEPDAERRGYGVEAFRLFCGHLFVELGIRELRAKVLPQNARSLALCRRCGFTRQGMSHGLVDLTLHSCDWPPVWLRNKVA
jgi:RimJ/RimL family protein N-acetyltransferase